MPSEVTHRVDTGQPYPVIRLAGVLDLASVAGVRSTLLHLLVTQPEAVLVDVSAVEVGDPDALTVLHDLVRETADWPAARMVLCAADPAPWHQAGLPIARTSTDALAGLGDPHPERRLSLELPPTVGAARRSRELITDACDRWERPDVAGSGCIVVTEMVNNVVAHAQTPMTVLLALRPDAISVAVRDHSAVVPRYTGVPVAPTSYGGRGLLLIDSVATRWGNLPLDDGKVVWALLPATAGDTRPGRAGMAEGARG